MPKEVGYWVDLFQQEVEFGDDNTSWIQAFPEGTYNHPLFGEMKFDQSNLADFAKSVKNRVRGVQPDIDYEHKMFGGEAAGWVEEARYEEGKGLALKVNWTPKARSAIANREYRYFSPTFAEEWEHPKTQKTHKNVLFGGALTNRPFLKDILPVNLSDIVEAPTPNQNTPQSEGDLMDPKTLRKTLGLAEDATDEQVNQKLGVLAALSEALTTAPSLAPAPGNVTPPATTPTTTTVPTTTTTTTTGTTLTPELALTLGLPPGAPSQSNPEGKSVEQLLAELGQVGQNPAIAALTNLMEAQRSEIMALRKDQHAQNVDRLLKELDYGKKFVVPPAVKDQLRHIMLNSPWELAGKVYDAYKQTIELGVVELDERGWARRGEIATPVETLNKEVAKLMEADKNLSYRDAYAAVSKDRPDLAQAVRQDAYIKEGS
jgi:phage I-like protein